MKLELERQEFLKAWQNAEKLTDAKNPKESAGGILITATEDNTVILEATDLKTSIRCKAQGVNVIEPGIAVVPAAMFGEMLKKLKADKMDDLTLEVNSTRGFLNAGRNKMRFAVIPAEQFPKLPESGGAEFVCELNAKTFGTLIAEGSSASSQPQDFPKYLGTCLIRTGEGSIMAVSTDGKRLSLSKAPCETPRNEDILLPAPALKELGKALTSFGEEETVKIFVDADGSTAWFALSNVEFSLRRVDAAFPKFERIINDERRTTLRIQTGDLIPALERIDIIAKATTAHVMTMTLNPDGVLRITARAPELGTTSETLQTNITGDSLHLGFNVGYFLDGLKALGACEAVIEFSGEEGQTRMKHAEDDKFLYMLMPARLSTQDAMTEEESADFSAETPEPMPAPEESQSEQPNDEQNQEGQQDNGNQETPF